MINSLLKFPNFFNYDEISFYNRAFNKVVKSYLFVYISNNISLQKDTDEKIKQNIKNSKIITIDQSEILNKEMNQRYIIVGFENTLILLEQSSLFYLNTLISDNTELFICFLSNTKDIIINSININQKEIEADSTLIDEMNSFKENLKTFKLTGLMTQIWPIILPCISAYLIKSSYLKLDKTRFQTFLSYRKNHTFIEMAQDDYIELRTIGFGTFFKVVLIYHFERSELYALKKQYRVDEEVPKLIKREKENYMELLNPIIPKFYGTVKGLNCIVIEYINGKSLKYIKNIELTIDNKISIIFELAYAFSYLHKNSYVFRDLKPNNVMIDDNKNAVLIDFDRLIKKGQNQTSNYATADFSSDFVAPEIKMSGKFSDKSDVYSIGKMIYYIMNSGGTNLKDYPIIDKLYQLCILENPEDRPPISDLITDLIDYHHKNIKIDLVSDIFGACIDHDENCMANLKQTLLKVDPNMISKISSELISQMNSAIENYKLSAEFNNPFEAFYLGITYFYGNHSEQEINESLMCLQQASDQYNFVNAQAILGYIYYEGLYVQQNINKSIHYLTLASNQNHPIAQYFLGEIYHFNKYVIKDIKKAFHYYSLSANNNNSFAQYSLGKIYESGESGEQDISKAIYYYTLAANQNHELALFRLGLIYQEGKYVSKNINKAIYYYELLAKQNGVEAQLKLGEIYLLGQGTTRNINKAIYYYSQAANQNNLYALTNLGIIYSHDTYGFFNIHKAIHYLTIAANQNFAQAQAELAFIYLHLHVPPDINKAIYFVTLAANQGYSIAQMNLGILYYQGLHVKKDINKAIHYFKLAANQNIPQAQYNLGCIYAEGIYVTRDINYAIHYLNLASNLNLKEAQHLLGVLYLDLKDINKAIHYLTLSANQNYSKAQRDLGNIYCEGKYVKQDFIKGIHYFKLSADQFDPKALFHLAFFHLYGQHVAKNITKAIHYFSLASNQNDASSQVFLGFFYINGFYVKKNVNKGFNMFLLSTQNGQKFSFLPLGYMLHEGVHVQRDIRQAIYYYKEGSSFNNTYCKNNLGVIYKTGIEGYIVPNTATAVEYFEEAIQKNNDYLAMYNLAIIHIYDDSFKSNLDKAIDLLINASNQFLMYAQKYNDQINFYLLLVLVFALKYENNFDKIEELLYEKVCNNEIDRFIIHNAVFQMKNEERNLKEQFEFYRDGYYLYDDMSIPISLNSFIKRGFNLNDNERHKQKDITSDFYEGFGIL